MHSVCWTRCIEDDECDQEQKAGPIVFAMIIIALAPPVQLEQLHSQPDSQPDGPAPERHHLIPHRPGSLRWLVWCAGRQQHGQLL